MSNVELVWGKAESDRIVSHITPEGLVYSVLYEGKGCFVAARRDTLGPKSKILGLRYRTRQLAMDAAARDYARLRLAIQRPRSRGSPARGRKSRITSE
jgi:hypothetical protein